MDYWYTNKTPSLFGMGYFSDSAPVSRSWIQHCDIVTSRKTINKPPPPRFTQRHIKLLLQLMKPPAEAGTGHGLAVEMQSEVVSNVLEMGYNPSIVRIAVQQQLREHCSGFTSRHELVAAVLELNIAVCELVIPFQFQRSLALEMQSWFVSVMLKMGYSRGMVQNAVKRHLREHGCGFSSAQELFDAIEEGERWHSWSSQMGNGGTGMDAVSVLDCPQKPLRQILVKLQQQLQQLREQPQDELPFPAAAPPPPPAGRVYTDFLSPGQQDKLKRKEADLNNTNDNTYRQPAAVPLPVPQAGRDIDPGEQYKIEQRRLASYITWPTGAPIQPRELAKAGFFYTGSDDRVQCFCCQGILRDWEVGDQAMNKHHKHFPSCQFVLNSNFRNIPIDDQDHKYGDTAMGECERLHPHCNFVNGRETRNKPLLPPPGVFPVPVTPAAVAPPTPAGRDYTDFFSPAQQNKLTRKEADPNLPRPPSTQQSVPSTLPASQSSGLYQPGLEKVVEDSMKCFYCEGELQNWEPEDKPWTEHAKWCKFLQQERGDDYVQGSGVQARFPNLQAQEQHMRPPDEAGTGHDKPDLQFQSSLAVEMQSQMVSDVLETGFEPNMVWNAGQQHVRDHGRGFASAHDLEGIVAVLDLEEKEKRMEISGPSQMGTGDFQCRTQELREERLENGSDTATGDATYHEDLDERMCKMCMETDVHIVFISCGHLTVSVCTYSFTMPPGLSTKCVNDTVAGFSS